MLQRNEAALGLSLIPIGSERACLTAACRAGGSLRYINGSPRPWVAEWVLGFLGFCCYGMVTVN